MRTIVEGDEPMRTIVEDINDLKDRFKIEFGLIVDVEILAHSQPHKHLKGYPMRQAIDLVIANDLEERPTMSGYDGMSRYDGIQWIRLIAPYRSKYGRTEITLFR